MIVRDNAVGFGQGIEALLDDRIGADGDSQSAFYAADVMVVSVVVFGQLDHAAAADHDVLDYAELFEQCQATVDAGLVDLTVLGAD